VLFSPVVRHVTFWQRFKTGAKTTRNYLHSILTMLSSLAWNMFHVSFLSGFYSITTATCAGSSKLPSCQNRNHTINQVIVEQSVVSFT
jgi:hypothetical protein